MNNPEIHIDRFLMPSSHQISTLAQQLRKYIKTETQPTTELVAQSTNSINFGYGFTRRPWDCYCAIIVYSKHINISFPSGSSLKDPIELLQGTGSRVRHIKVGHVADLEKPAVKALLLQAREMALEIADESDKKIDEFQTFVRT